MQYVKYNDDGSIWGVSGNPFPGAVGRADGSVVRVDGVWYDKGKEPVKTPEQVQAKAKAVRHAEIYAQLDTLDAKGARAARAVALAVAQGETPDAADVGRLTAIEAEAQALRRELAG